MFSERFQGPPGAANGGFVAGTLARQMEGAVAVTLSKPVPLARPLGIVRDGPAATLFDGDVALVRAEPATLDVDLPEPVSYEQAIEATKRFPVEVHPYPGCFVCGPARTWGDALCLFTGPTSDRRAVAAPWVPDPHLCRDVSGSDEVDAPVELVWSVLDCPGLWSIYLAPGIGPQPMLLGRITARVLERPRVGEKHVVMGFFTGRERRKHFCDTAVFDANGRVCAVARSIWIAVPG